MEVPVTETHLQLIDKIVGEGTYGKTREEVLNTVVLEHARHLLMGGGPYDSGGQTIVEVAKPQYGKKRDDILLQPITGKAIPVNEGEILRITQVVSGQCVDFNGFNLHDYKEHLSCGYTRSQGISTGKGAIAWSGSPRARPMYAILDCSENFDQYFAGHRCNAISQERVLGLTDHPNCQDTIAEAIREYGLTPDDVHTSYNFWMHTTLDSQGHRQFHWNRARQGDYVDILALFDTLSVPAICGSDVGSTNNYDYAPVQLQVFEASQATLNLADLIKKRFGSYKSQKTAANFKVKDIRVERKLARDLNYAAEFIPPPRKVTLELSMLSEVGRTLESLMKTGIYGDTVQKALIVCFFRWYDVNRLGNRLVKLLIRENESS